MPDAKRQSAPSRAPWADTEPPFRLFVESVKDYAIFMLDESGHVMSWNAGAERLKGYTREEILGSHFSRFYPRDDAAAGKPDRGLRIAAREGRFQEEGWRIRKDGSEFWANVVITAVRDDSGRLVGFGKVTRDMTEVHLLTLEIQRRARELEGEVLRRTEELRIANDELQHANAALHTFTHSVAHDLRGPLRTIQGFAEILLEDHADRLDDEGRDYLGRTAAAARRLADLVQNLLTYARLARSGAVSSREPVSWDRTVQDGLKELRSEIERARATVTVRAPLGQVRGHRETLAIVLRNLVTNAIKFVAPGRDPEVEIGAHRVAHRIRLYVRDHGIGIPAEEQARIFTPFERLHANAVYPGTGLGLAIVAEAVHRLGGALGVESDGRAGTCFWIELDESVPSGDHARVIPDPAG